MIKIIQCVLLVIAFSTPSFSVIGIGGFPSKVKSVVTDSQSGSGAYVSPAGGLRITEPTRLVGTTFNGTVFDENFWSTHTVNGATANVVGGEVLLTLSGTANSSAGVHTQRIARFVITNPNAFRSIIKFSSITIATGSNDRRWGLTTDDENDQIFFSHNDDICYIGYTKGGVETLISTNSLNGKYTGNCDDGLYHKYSIIYTPLTIQWFADNVIVHTIKATTDMLVGTFDFKASAHNENTDGEDGAHTLNVKALAISRLGQMTTNSTFKHIDTAGSYNLKFGGGMLHNIVANESGTAGTSFVVYNSTYAETGTEIAMIDTYKTSLLNAAYHLPFNNLFVVGTGTFGDITIVYE